MKYSLDDAASEIGRRRKRLIYLKKRRNAVCLAIMSVITILLLSISLHDLAGFGVVDDRLSVYGSLMLPDEAGGYILVGVLCFVAAVIITLLCIRKKNKDLQE